MVYPGSDWLTSRTQFAPMLGNCGASLVDPRGKLVARSYDILGGVSFFFLLLHSVHSEIPICSLLNLIYAGLYSTFVFQKPDPDAIPPIVTPDLNDVDDAHEEVRSSLPSSYRHFFPCFTGQ
jgi:mRNA (guanine-N7-)-methyltransferase